jgi:hypothetical protein
MSFEASFKVKHPKEGGYSFYWHTSGLPNAYLRLHWYPPWHEYNKRGIVSVQGKTIVRGFRLFFRIWKLDIMLQVQRHIHTSNAKKPRQVVTTKDLGRHTKNSMASNTHPMMRYDAIISKAL